MTNTLNRKYLDGLSTGLLQTLRDDFKKNAWELQKNMVVAFEAKDQNKLAALSEELQQLANKSGAQHIEYLATEIYEDVEAGELGRCMNPIFSLSKDLQVFMVTLDEMISQKKPESKSGCNEDVYDAICQLTHDINNAVAMGVGNVGLMSMGKVDGNRIEAIRTSFDKITALTKEIRSLVVDS